ncbi:FH1/FH2 domain-containing protein 3 [Collichthys lucidus]|uniref:FH1/FH2 domain-containing protein 3 n=1 Tax=Collichthys lucidus TaxID=240159 RepID=A0A4U5V387_COLLU|nr:FH1/FH2 domain-containing protein 3 [Collichthys lucidus]
MATFVCRVQFLDDTDPFNSTNFPEPTRPPLYTFREDIPLINQIAGVHRLLKAPHKPDDCALQLSHNGSYLDLESTLAEQRDELEGFQEEGGPQIFRLSHHILSSLSGQLCFHYFHFFSDPLGRCCVDARKHTKFSFEERKSAVEKNQRDCQTQYGSNFKEGNKTPVVPSVFAEQFMGIINRIEQLGDCSALRLHHVDIDSRERCSPRCAESVDVCGSFLWALIGLRGEALALLYPNASNAPVDKAKEHGAGSHPMVQWLLLWVLGLRPELYEGVVQQTSDGRMETNREGDDVGAIAVTFPKLHSGRVKTHCCLIVTNSGGLLLALRQSEQSHSLCASSIKAHLSESRIRRGVVEQLYLLCSCLQCVSTGTGTPVAPRVSQYVVVTSSGSTEMSAMFVLSTVCRGRQQEQLCWTGVTEEDKYGLLCSSVISALEISDSYIRCLLKLHN